MTRFGFFGRLAAGVGAAVAAPVVRAMAPVAEAEPYAMGVGRMATFTGSLGTAYAGPATTFELDAATMPDLIQTTSYGSALANLNGAAYP